jgi:hypothetical protein
MARPMVMPPALVPIPAKCAGEVYLWRIKYLAQAMKSRQVFGFVGPLPAKCHFSP